jgi:hypothetical protein
LPIRSVFSAEYDKSASVDVLVLLNASPCDASRCGTKILPGSLPNSMFAAPEPGAGEPTTHSNGAPTLGVRHDKQVDTIAGKPSLTVARAFAASALQRGSIDQSALRDGSVETRGTVPGQMKKAASRYRHQVPGPRPGICASSCPKSRCRDPISVPFVRH